mgnify:CR=1 FL=1
MNSLHRAQFWKVLASPNLSFSDPFFYVFSCFFQDPLLDLIFLRPRALVHFVICFLIVPTLCLENSELEGIGLDVSDMSVTELFMPSSEPC